MSRHATSISENHFNCNFSIAALPKTPYATNAEAVLDSLSLANAQNCQVYYFHTGGSVPTLL